MQTPRFLPIAALLLASLLATETAAAQESAYPPMGFSASVVADEVYAALKKSPVFAHLDRETVGSPVYVRVTHSVQPTAGGTATGLASAILTGGTLGLIPLVVNNDLVITYDMVVHGRVLTSYTYKKNFTKAVNIYATDTTHGMGKDGYAWFLSTIEEFKAAAAVDAKLNALKDEYQFYFGKGGAVLPASAVRGEK